MTLDLPSAPHRPALLLPLFLALALFLFPPSAHAGINEVILDEHMLSQLELRASQAGPREQCFLYTELVHAATELAGRQMLAGDLENASASLKRVEHYAQLIHLGLADDTKRLKNAEMLMHHTTYRLSEYMHAVSSDDRETLQATLKQLNQVQDELLAQVFKH